MDGVTPPTSTFSPLSTGLPEWPPQQHEHLENLSPPLDWAEQSLPVFLSQSSSHGLGHGLRRCTTVTFNPQYSIQGEAGSLGSMGSDLLWRREERVTCRQCLNQGVDHNPSRHESTHSPDSSSPRHPRPKTKKKKKKKKKRRDQSPTSISYSSGEFRHASVNCDIQLPAEDDPDQQLWHECVLASRPSTSGGTKGKDQTGRVFGCCCGATSDDSDDETTFLVQSKEYGIPYPWEVNTTRRRLATALKTVLCCCCCCGGGQQ